MKAVVQAFWLPKHGNSPEEYEDAYCPKNWDSYDREVQYVRLAVADGATEASFSGPWALQLARAYCNGKMLPEKISDHLAELQHKWKTRVHTKALPWYAEEKLESGAFAAIAGIDIRHEGQLWKAFAIGDCCIFHTRADAILASFQMDSAEQFDNRPLLLSSAAHGNERVLESVKSAVGTWETGDTFYLMSDAMAAWFLRHASLPTADTVQYIKHLRTQSEFADFVALQRSDRREDGTPMMRNDDVTLLSCTVT